MDLKSALRKILSTILFDYLIDGKLNDPSTFLELLDVARDVIKREYKL